MITLAVATVVFWCSKNIMNSSWHMGHSEIWSTILFFVRTDVEVSKDLAIARGEGHLLRPDGLREEA